MSERKKNIQKAAFNNCFTYTDTNISVRFV